MKRVKTRSNRNFHVQKRIQEDLHRRHGIPYVHPFACDTQPDIIVSARALHADERSCVSRRNVLQQHISVPHHDTSSTQDVHHLQARRCYPQDLRLENHRISRLLGYDISTDYYLLGNIGIIPDQSNFCKFGESDCGISWTCDQCEERAVSFDIQVELQPTCELLHLCDIHEYQVPWEWNLSTGLLHLTDLYLYQSSEEWNLSTGILHLYDATIHQSFTGHLSTSDLSLDYCGATTQEDFQFGQWEYTLEHVYCSVISVIHCVFQVLVSLQLHQDLSINEIFSGLSHHYGSSSLLTSSGGGATVPLLTGIRRIVFDRGKSLCRSLSTPMVSSAAS